MNRGLRKLISVHRYRVYVPPVEQPTEDIDPPISTNYTIDDFGDNVINNHWAIHGSHSERCQMIFNYVTRNYRNQCTSFQTYNNTQLGNTFTTRSEYLTKAALVHADMIFSPYVNAAYSSEGEYFDFVLPVASHYDNNSSDGIIDNDDRHDITDNAETLLVNTVAVGARRDTPELFTTSTSYGFGMEFFEDCSKEGLDYQFPDKDISDAFAELMSEDGINLTSNIHINFANSLTIGETITIRYSAAENTWVNTTVSEILAPNHIRVSTQVPVITTTGIYGWKLFTLGETMWGQAQSWAVPLVAGKLKVIKLATGANWDTVRAAARATAKRNPTGIPEIDNANWDIYRGFGCIQIQDAITYINNII